MLGVVIYVMDALMRVGGYICTLLFSNNIQDRRTFLVDCVDFAAVSGDLL